MPPRIDKRDRVLLFRARLQAAMEGAGLSQAALARAVGVDRSTVSQLLDDRTARLPNAQVAAECATALGVSADWLLGLTDLREPAAHLLAAGMTMSEAHRALSDAQVLGWYREAAGYKIRHVPATLPDLLKTPEVLGWEYEPALGRSTEAAQGAARDRLDWMRQARSDFEIALPLHELESFARGEGYWRGLPRAWREGQVDRLAELHAELYPTLRLHLYDARRVFSAPLTVFGPLRAVVYLGSHHLAFRDSDRVQAIARHFDGLVREAAVPSRDVPAFLDGLRAAL